MMGSGRMFRYFYSFTGSRFQFIMLPKAVGKFCDFLKFFHMFIIFQVFTLHEIISIFQMIRDTCHQESVISDHTTSQVQVHCDF